MREARDNEETAQAAQKQHQTE